MTNETRQNRNKPPFRIFIVNGEGESARWQNAGACWPHSDGKGFSVSLDAIPINGGRLVIRAANEDIEVASEGQP